jgi:two-component system cell cycle response regulator DivK
MVFNLKGGKPMSLFIGEARTVLIVDDSDDIRELVGMQLRMKGCQVVEAANGKEAVEIAPRVRPDLILMDLSMPVLDGYEATRQIRSQPTLNSVPIVAVSAYCDAHNRHKAIEAGCVECVCKPVDFGMIDGLLKKHLRVH